MITIYHNPRCSKSRQALSLIEEKGAKPTIIQYLDTPPDRATIVDLLKKLDLSPRDILRKGEDAYKEMALDNKNLSDEQLIDAIIKAPKLLERPIVVKGDKAIVGRPPENVLKLF